MSRSRPMCLNRLGILVWAGILCLWAAASPARAAGCHVPDRPVLGTKLSWEQDQRVDPGFPWAALAPPVLTHPPCPGEVPHVLNAGNTTLGWALLVDAGFDPATRSEVVRAGDQVEHVDPEGSRLDRPPRSFESRLVSA